MTSECSIWEKSKLSDDKRVSPLTSWRGVKVNFSQSYAGIYAFTRCYERSIKPHRGIAYWEGNAETVL